MKTKIRYSDWQKETGVPWEIAAYWIRRGKLDTTMHRNDRVVLKNDKYIRFMAVLQALVDAGVFEGCV